MPRPTSATALSGPSFVQAAQAWLERLGPAPRGGSGDAGDEPLRAEPFSADQMSQHARRPAAGERGLTPAAEWLLDNFHLIEEEVRTTADGGSRDRGVQRAEAPSGLTVDDMAVAGSAVPLAWICTSPVSRRPHCRRTFMLHRSKLTGRLHAARPGGHS